MRRVPGTAGDGIEVIVRSPAGTPDPAIPIAAGRAGALGLLDLAFARDAKAIDGALGRLERLARAPYGVDVGESLELLDRLLRDDLERLRWVLLAGTAPELAAAIDAVHERGRKAAVVAYTVEQARAAAESGADSVIAKGHEAAGLVGPHGAFVFLQRCLDAVDIPVWAQGGIGLRTAAACAVAGAEGVVLDSQVLLCRESPLRARQREQVAAMDGSEAVLLGAALGTPVRILLRPDLDAATALRDEVERLEGEGADDAAVRWRESVAERLDWTGAHGTVLAVGQDGAFAAELARRFGTVGGVVGAIRRAVDEHLAALAEENPIARSGPLAASHRTTHPIVQGPMTRVSDRAEFAAAVAEAGALPFLALALLRGPEVRKLLADTAALLGDRPWGVGILGFVPAELRSEQIEAVREARPPFALIAGGRPDQARVLEQDGTATYLHVPSPGLLRLYLKDGARQFVFEGRECGGHVGPRTSFVLWETMVAGLLDALPAEGNEDVHVLFAGGIHDARSAAMVAALAAPLARRGVRVGVLMGTAYLFTEEAVSCGAITAEYQQAALEGGETVLLETGPGHATRCLPSPFVEEFASVRRRLLAEGVPPGERRDRLEELNIGRLRIASKGLTRNPGHGSDPDAPKLIPVEPDEQWRQGMYMIGEVAAMRDRLTTLARLHDDVTDGAARMIAALQRPRRVARRAGRPADVAIIGMGTILPGAPDLETYWSNILNKVDAIAEVPPDRWDWRAYFDEDRSAPDRIYSRWGGFVGDVEFDPTAFGMPPNTLRSIEPFQLLGLLVAKAALRDAGYDEGREWDRERASVILGAGGGGGDLAVGYTVRSALPALMGDDGERLIEALDHRLPVWTEDSFAGLLMNVAAGRIANRLDFGGTNFTVDAACGSSLAAVTLGVRDLQARNSDMVVVGGVDAIQNPFAFLCFSKTQALSPTGRCKPFDASADGIAISEGFAAVVLKRLEDAERDGDRIYAVIRGVGSASDGRDRSLTAPRPEGQMRALRRAYEHAGVSPADVGLIEAHGTGTVAGDRAEIASLRRVFEEHGAARRSCAIGSVKSMIGHTKATAGVAGLVKAAMALHHRVLPPTLHVDRPNPHADFDSSPFYPNIEARPWIRPDGERRRAGVSAFGFGGTNFHVVLEEYDGDPRGDRSLALDRLPAELLLWRAETPDALADEVRSLAGRLEAGARPRLPDLALTLASRARDADPSRPSLAIVATDLDDLLGKLRSAADALASGHQRRHAPDGVHLSLRPLAADGGLALLFPGQGSQVVEMGRELAVVFPEAREVFDRADKALEDRLEERLSRYIFPPPAFDDDKRRLQQERLTDTQVAQPALGAVDLAYLKVLDGLGLRPTMAAGHSYGELVALAAAGSLADDDLLRLSEARGRHMREGAADEPGAMAAVDAAPEALDELVEGDGELVLANLNSPRQTVIAGSRAAIERALEWCGRRGLRARRLPVACAFHSPYVAPARERFAQDLAATQLRAPAFPVFSNTTAQPHAPDPQELVATLADHLVRPVRFAEQITAMHDAGARVFLEVGPRNVLTGLVGQILGDREHVAVAVAPSNRPGVEGLLHALAAIAVEGVPVRAGRLLDGRRAEPLDLRTLEPAAGRPPRPRALWLVNGGRARPADQDPLPTTPLRLDEVTMSATNGAKANGSRAPDTARTAAAQVPAVREAAAQPAPEPLADAVPFDTGPPDLDGAGVMGGHHRLMQHFLAAHRDVMLAYLGACGRAGNGAASARSRPAPTRTAALPAAQPDPAPTAPVAAPPEIAPQGPAPGATEQPAEAETPAPQATEARPSSNGAVDIGTRLLEVVSERTGYPPDMLDLEADLESDLGVDSIKRVEIAGTLAQELSLPDGVEPDVERLTASRTLREVIAVLEELVSGASDGAGEEDGAERKVGAPAPFEHEPVGGRIGRFVLNVAGAPAADGRARLAADGMVVVVDDGRGTGREVARLLAERGERAAVVDGEATRDPEAAAPLLADARREAGRVKALIHLAALDDPAAPLLEGLLRLAQVVREDLEAAAADGGAAVIGVTRMGGTFAVEPGDAGARLEPRQAVVPGFLKSLAQEWPQVRVRAVDLDDGAAEDPRRAAEHVVTELLSADGGLEVGYRDGERVTLELHESDVDRATAALELDSDSVVLVTGGARGITAAAAIELARRARPTLMLAGRTELPDEDEDPATASLTDPRELQQAIIERERAAGRRPSPREVRAEVSGLLAVREVRATLGALRDLGASAEYRCCDVSDPEQLTRLLDEVKAAHGRLDGVIHGAGIIEDKLVRDKKLDSARRVMAVKAGAALNLADRLDPDSLRFLVFFSSVSGRFGNRGQADYAAASEILNKLAVRLDRAWPRTRVVAIDWGPWAATGMVSPEVARRFAERGVDLIPVEVGARRLVDELLHGRKGESEVVIAGGSSLPWADAAPAARCDEGEERPAPAILAVATELDAPSPGRAEAVRHLQLDVDRYLDDHRLDDVPVLPFAGALELMAAAAQVARPDLTVTALEDVRLHQGVTLPEPVTLRIAAEPAHGDGDGAAARFEVTLTPEGQPRPSYQAAVTLAASSPEPRPAEPPAGLPASPVSAEEAYRDLLFHGPAFQGIEAIEALGPQGAIARLRASAPSDCLAGLAGGDWLLDPVLIDCALQMQVVWARTHWDITPLPSSLGALRRYGPAPAPGEVVRHELRLQPTSRPPMCTADHQLYGADGRLIATLTGMLGVGSRALNRLAGSVTA